MKAIVYNKETGELVRAMSGSVPLENQNLKDDEAIIVYGAGEIPEAMDIVKTSEEFDTSIAGKRMDLESNRIIDDPNATDPSQNRRNKDIKKDLEAGNITEREALLELLD